MELYIGCRSGTCKLERLQYVHPSRGTTRSFIFSLHKPIEEAGCFSVASRLFEKHISRAYTNTGIATSPLPVSRPVVGLMLFGGKVSPMVMFLAELIQFLFLGLRRRDKAYHMAMKYKL
jgi:hypothetical protein